MVRYTFNENSERLKAVFTKSSILDVWVDSEYVLNVRSFSCDNTGYICSGSLRKIIQYMLLEKSVSGLFAIRKKQTRENFKSSSS